jgi:hypothetical protein
VLRYLGGCIVGFNERGVDIFDGGFTLETMARVEAYPPGTWALLDTLFTDWGNEKGTPTGIFNLPHLSVVFTTSQEVTRFQEWQKQVAARLKIMEPWSLEEYSSVA